MICKTNVNSNIWFTHDLYLYTNLVVKKRIKKSNVCYKVSLVDKKSIIDQIKF